MIFPRQSNYQQCAIRLTPDGHPNLPSRLDSLGSSFTSRFQCTGDLDDIFEAIKHHQRAVQLIPNGHPSIYQPGSTISETHFRFASNALETCVISQKQSSINNVPSNSPQIEIPASQATSTISESHCFVAFDALETLMISLRQSNIYSMRSNIPQMDMSICQDTSRISEPHFLVASSALENCLIFPRQSNINNMRSNSLQMDMPICQSGSTISDTHIQVALNTQVAWMISQRQLKVNNMLFNSSQMDTPISQPCSTISDTHFRVASNAPENKNFSQKLCQVTAPPLIPLLGSPSVRLQAATQWATLSQKSPFRHHSFWMPLLVPSIFYPLFQAWRTPFNVAMKLLVNSSQLSIAASAAALSLGHPDKALEWLVEGRCIVWNQINQLRTPVDELRVHNQSLADRFSAVSRELENAGSRSESQASAAQKRVSQWIIESRWKNRQESISSSQKNGTSYSSPSEISLALKIFSDQKMCRYYAWSPRRRSCCHHQYPQ
jgi:hypothetical protein